MNESWHTYEWVMAHLWMSYGTHMNESWHTYECAWSMCTYEWVMAHLWMSYGTLMNESWHTYECAKFMCTTQVHSNSKRMYNHETTLNACVCVCVTLYIVNLMCVRVRVNVCIVTLMCTHRVQSGGLSVRSYRHRIWDSTPCMHINDAKFKLFSKHTVSLSPLLKHVCRVLPKGRQSPKNAHKKKTDNLGKDRVVLCKKSPAIYEERTTHTHTHTHTQAHTHTHTHAHAPFLENICCILPKGRSKEKKKNRKKELSYKKSTFFLQRTSPWTLSLLTPFIFFKQGSLLSKTNITISTHLSMSAFATYSQKRALMGEKERGGKKKRLSYQKNTIIPTHLSLSTYAA